jgi:peroxiredoxin
MNASLPPLPAFLGAPGDPAPDFSLRDLNGVVFHLREARGKRPVVIEFGSAT